MKEITHDSRALGGGLPQPLPGPQRPEKVEATSHTTPLTLRRRRKWRAWKRVERQRPKLAEDLGLTVEDLKYSLPGSRPGCTGRHRIPVEEQHWKSQTVIKVKRHSGTPGLIALTHAQAFKTARNEEDLIETLEQQIGGADLVVRLGLANWKRYTKSERRAHRRSLKDNLSGSNGGGPGALAGRPTFNQAEFEAHRALLRRADFRPEPELSSGQPPG